MENATAPFPCRGRKSRWAKAVWERLGDPDVYIEPCAGSLDALLGRPTKPKTEIVADANGFICNFWRALRQDPDGLAREAGYPAIEQDLTARRRWLLSWGKDNGPKLARDPDYCDLQAAGWWAWGAAALVDSEWCLPRGGQGLRARRMEPKGEMDTGERLTRRFRALAERLARVVVLNRDWKAAVAPAMLREHGKRETTTAVFLDGTSEDATQEAWEWSRWMGEKYRIAYACREGEVEPPKGWEKLAESEWTISPDGAGGRETVLFSPTCIVPQPSLFGPDF